MPKKTWTIELEDGQHVVEFELKTFGKRSTRVDGQVIDEGRVKSFEMGGDYPFEIGAHTVVVHTRSGGLVFNYDLSIDGRSLSTGEAVAPLIPMPIWAWIFIVACLALFVSPFVLGFGGVLPAGVAGGIGGGGAALCAVIARDPSRMKGVRVGLCAAVIRLVAGVPLLCCLVKLALQGRNWLPGRSSPLRKADSPFPCRALRLKTSSRWIH